jgi:hypothetical protein
MYLIFKAGSLEQNCKPNLIQCGLCGGPTHSFNILSSEMDRDKGKTGFSDIDLATIRKVTNLGVNWFKYFWYLDYLLFGSIQLGNQCLASSLRLLLPLFFFFFFLWYTFSSFAMQAALVT